MAAEDQRMRLKAMKTGQWDLSVDTKNTEEMKKVVAEHGWPTISLAGRRGSFEAWLLVQHADHDVRFQKRALAMLKSIYRKTKDVSPANIAYLTDRILVAEGKKQIFGTQFHEVKGDLKPRPMRDMAHVDRRRSKVGLPPFREDIEAAQEFSRRTRKKPRSVDLKPSR